MKDNKANLQAESSPDEKLAAESIEGRQTEDSQPEDNQLLDEQLENTVGGTAIPPSRLEDLDNQTIDRPVDAVTT